MIIVYGWRSRFKPEAQLGTEKCENCGHTAEHILAKQLNQATLFGLPIVSITAKRGIMCTCCGHFKLLSNDEYKAEKSSAEMSVK